MRRRFGRRRRRDSAEDGRSPIDASWLERIVSAGLVPVQSLEPLEIEGVPDTVCRLGIGDLESGGRCVVAYSPHSASEALLGLVAALPRVPGLDRGDAVAIAPTWDSRDRRLLGTLSATPLPVRALAAPGLGGAPLVSPERAARALPESPAQLGAGLPTAAERLVFSRALAGLEGLAAKHGGTVRGAGGSAELVVLARRVAVLRAGGQGPSLEILEPTRAQHGLSEDNLAEVLDRLEGSVRKCLSDRRLRDSAGGTRARLAPFLARASRAEWWHLWPSGSDELEPVDFVGTEADGSPVLGVVAARLDLPSLAAALRASVAVEPWLGELLRSAPLGARSAAPKLRIASAEIDGAIDAVLACVETDLCVYDVAISGSAAPRLTERSVAAARSEAGTAAATTSDSRASSSRGPRTDVAAPSGRARRSDSSDSAAPSGRAQRSDSSDSAASPRSGPSSRGGERDGEREASGTERAGVLEDGRGEDSENGARREGSRRRRGRGRGRRGGRPSESAEASERGDEGAEESAPTRPKFLEISAFDLDDPPSGEDGGEEGRRGSRRRRSRGRGRSRRDGGAAADDEPEPGSDTDPERDADLDEDGDAVLELAEAPEPDDTDAPIYDEDELQEEPLSAADRLRLERGRRRRARIAAAAPLTEQPKEEDGPVEIEPAALPRGRTAILACADRDSVFSALLLAREVRTIEGIWVYPQDELMRFFRSVATDLRANSPLFVVGFEPRPSHDVLQAAGLYRDRLAWFDHHEWPPEDVHAMRGAIGAGMVHLAPGAGSSLPAVLSLSTRRSRFSDKLVDLATGRFTQHDWERWGRLWWHRVGEVAARHGEHRNDLDSLLAGRPSDLAKEAERSPTPPPPPEATFVASKDSRLVHFGDHGLVVAEVPAGLDPGLTARIMRERYGATLSLVREEGGCTCLLGSDDSRQAIDVGSMADHLAMKFAWVDSLPDADHVARIRIRDLDRSPERLDEVISEIAMGRSILEG